MNCDKEIPDYKEKNNALIWRGLYMNELKTIKSELPVIEFNYEEIEQDLEKNLQKYNGLTFTEDDVSECKKTIAELRKGKKAVDDYRKEKKKELSAPVVEFESKCKSLNQKFDSVINPLIEQHETFEQKRKDEKREKAQEVISELIEQHDLLEKYATQLIVEDSFLTKSKTIKFVTEELETKAQHLKMQQGKEESNKQVIQNNIQFINAEHGVSFSESPYINLLDYKELGTIKRQIMADVYKELDKQAEKRKEQELQKEESPKQAETKIEQSVPAELPSMDDDFMPDPFITDKDNVRTYVVFGTNEKLEALELFMNQNQISWDVYGDE